MEKGSLRRRLIKPKFGSRSFDFKPADGSRVSSRSPWKFIMGKQGLIHNDIQYKLQNGESTAFWTDQWVRWQSSETDLPKTFWYCCHQRSFHYWIWNEVTASWVLNFRRHLKDEEISEWASLRHCIPNVRLTQHVDPWIWKLESSGLFSSKSLYTKLISIHTSIAQNFYTKIWNCLAQRELNFSFGKLSIHVSTQPTDSKNAALGFVYLLRGGVCAKMMSDHDWRGLLWKLSSRAIHLGHSPHRAGSSQVAHGLCRKSQLSPERSSLGFQQFYQPKDYHLGRMQPVNTFSNSDKLSEGTSP